MNVSAEGGLLALAGMGLASLYVGFYKKLQFSFILRSGLGSPPTLLPTPGMGYPTFGAVGPPAACGGGV